jgi:hypothetical protein
MEIVCPSCRHYYFDNRNIHPMTLMLDSHKQIPAFSCKDCGTIFRPLDPADESEWREMMEALAKQKLLLNPTRISQVAPMK